MTSNSMASSISELLILKCFKVDCHPPKADRIIQVIWISPPCGWNKVNTDGAAKGCPSLAGGGGFFRDRMGVVLGCFVEFYGSVHSFSAELYAVMSSIRIAAARGWKKLSMECDSSLVIQAFSNPEIVPWKIKIKWKNCIIVASSFDFKVTHIYREGNHCADKLASFGVASRCFTWWDLIPSFIRDDFDRDRWSLPNYRFT